MDIVTSLAEVWIETRIGQSPRHWIPVTSLAEVWIETGENADIHKMSMSLPLRKCGLKLSYLLKKYGTVRHFPCGSVD